MQERGIGTAPLTSEPDAPARPARDAGRARWRLLLGVAAFVLVADQLTKWWAVESLTNRTIDIVGSLRLNLAMNYGSAFSVAEGRGALVRVDAGERLDLGGMDDCRVQACFDRFVEEDRVDHFAGGRVEAERHIRNAENGPGPG